MEDRHSRELTRKKSLEELYLLMASKIETALTHLCEAIHAFSNKEIKKLEQLTITIIGIEREADSIHDDVIARMYSKETLFFSRQDRLYVISAMDDIIDSADTAIRRMSTYYPSPHPDLIPFLEEAAENVLIMGKKTHKMMKMFFESLKKTKPIIIEIEDIRRESREIEFKYKETLFSLDLTPREYIQYERVIAKILKVVSHAKSLSTGLRSMVFKYEL